MNNNKNEIERIELGMTPFDMVGGGDDPTVLDLNNDPITKTEILEDPEKEVIPPKPLENDPEGTPEAKIDDPNEVDEPLEDEYDVKIKANLAKYAAEALKAKGGLPEDFEISDDITEEQIDQAYNDYKEETLRNQVRLEELKRLEEEEGITPKMLEEIKLKHYGVQDQEIQQLNALEFLSTYQFDDKSEHFEQDAREFLINYYSLKGINQSRISKLVERDLDDEELNLVLTEAQKDLSQDYLKLDQSIRDKAEQKRIDIENQRKQNREKVNNLLSKEGFAGRTSEELEIVRKALFDKTEIVVGPDGKKYKTTLYYKRQMEAQQDLEKNLESKINFILGGESTTLKNKERDKATKKIMNRLNEYVEVDIKPSNKNTSRKTESNNDKKGIERVEIN